MRHASGSRFDRNFFLWLDYERKHGSEFNQGMRRGSADSVAFNISKIAKKINPPQLSEGLFVIKFYLVTTGVAGTTL